MRHVPTGPAAAAALLCIIAVCAGAAEPAAPQITTLLAAPLSGDDSKQVIVSSAVFPTGTTTGRHIHPGDEYATVLAGAVEIHVEGQAPKRVNAGESYHNARGIVHETKSVGEVAARLVSTFVIDKGQPLVQPAE